MPVTRLNHAVLYVRDVARSVEFYSEVLGFRTVMSLPGAAFLQAAGSNNDHDLGLFQIGPGAGASTAGRSTVGLYHLAWEVDTLETLERIALVLKEHHALTGASDHHTTKAVYGRDPDGIEFEIAWLVPADRLGELGARSQDDLRPQPLDLAREKERFGATTRGGVGVSFPDPRAQDDGGTPSD